MATAQDFFDTIGDMKTNLTPAERFRAFRTQLGLTGQALAEPLGVTKTAISYWESGRVSLSQTACILAEHLYKISSTWLLTGEGPMWLSAPVPTLAAAPDLVLRPLLPKGSFREDGSVIAPRDGAPCLGLPRPLVDALLAGGEGGTTNDLFFVHVHDREMEPGLSPNDWALVNTALPVRGVIVDHGLYLVRLRSQDEPKVRRVAVDPASGDLLIAVDAPGHVPYRVAVSRDCQPTLVLGRVCWAGCRR